MWWLLARINLTQYIYIYTLSLSHSYTQREELFAAMDEVTAQCATLEDELEKAKRLNQSKMLERDQAMAECKEVCVLSSVCTTQ